MTKINDNTPVAIHSFQVPKSTYLPMNMFVIPFPNANAMSSSSSIIISLFP